MKKSLFLMGLFALLISCKGNVSKNIPQTDKPQPVNLILDTDLGPDYDDVGAMALMHALADSGQVNILATLSSNHDERVIPCIEVLNTYFNRPDIPVGAPKSEPGASLTTWHKTKWTDELPANYPHHTAKTSDAPDALKVYRKILSEQPDTSVVICTIGFFSNLRDLLQSGADEYSNLSGKELVAKKVKRLVSMAGLFPEGKEFNVYCDVPASKVVAEEWPTEIVFSGFEIGNVILTGKKLVQMNVENSPVKDAYALCFAEGDPEGRMSWDHTAVLVAIKGYEPYFDVERGTFHVVDDEGTNNWVANPNGRDLRLIEKMPPTEVASLIENYMMHQPSIMYIVQDYSLAVIFCVVTMLCWGSWGNTQKLASKTWRYEFFYWDYVIGVLLLSLISGFTLGSIGTEGRSFLPDLAQANLASLGSAFLGGIIFNAANILLSAAIAICGLSVAFPVGIGLALVLGVLVNYFGAAKGEPTYIFIGVALITVAIILNGLAYKKALVGTKKVSGKGILISVVAGVIMAFFYRFVAASMDMENFASPAPGKLTPYTAVFVFAIGVFVSNFLFNTLAMKHPVEGKPVSISGYFKGDMSTHLVGVLGGVIWCIGQSFSMIASEKAGAAISYGLGQGATLVSALWGILIWKEFKGAPAISNRLNVGMFILFVIGLGFLIYAGA